MRRIVSRGRSRSCLHRSRGSIGRKGGLCCLRRRSSRVLRPGGEIGRVVDWLRRRCSLGSFVFRSRCCGSRVAWLFVLGLLGSLVFRSRRGLVLRSRGVVRGLLILRNGVGRGRIRRLSLILRFFRLNGSILGCRRFVPWCFGLGGSILRFRSFILGRRW